MEDDVLVRSLVVEILTAHGYTVETVEKFEELEAILQHSSKCALLLTDVVMPRISGPELASKAGRTALAWHQDPLHVGLHHECDRSSRDA